MCINSITAYFLYSKENIESIFCKTEDCFLKSFKMGLQFVDKINQQIQWQKYTLLNYLNLLERLTMTEDAV